MFFIYQNPLVVGATIIEVSSTQQASSLASQIGLVAGQYGVFNDLSGLPSDWQLFPEGVTFSPGPNPTYSYNLAGAKYEAKNKVKFQNAQETGIAMNNLSPQLLAAQATLPAGDRIPEVQTAISQLNALGAQLEAQLIAIDDATSISELNDIVNPPAINGTIRLTRDFFSLAYSEFLSLSGTSPTSLVLYFPSTDSTLPYDEMIQGYSSGEDQVFIPGNFTVLLQYGVTTIGTFELTSDGSTEFDFNYVP